MKDAESPRDRKEEGARGSFCDERKSLGASSLWRRGEQLEKKEEKRVRGDGRGYECIYILCSTVNFTVGSFSLTIMKGSDWTKTSSERERLVKKKLDSTGEEERLERFI
jgi:hypothetical protein